MKKSSRFILLLTLALLTLHTAAALAEMVAVSNENVNMRSSPSEQSNVLWKLGQGFPLKVVKRSGKWLQVRDFEGSSGWIHKNVVSRSGHMIVKKRKINLRSSPSEQGKVVAKAGYGVVFKTLEKKKGWVKVKQDGVTGWVSEGLLWGF